jgi:hypothetical protein
VFCAINDEMSNDNICWNHFGVTTQKMQHVHTHSHICYTLGKW